jgi:hypothetical protein
MAILTIVNCVFGISLAKAAFISSNYSEMEV